MDKSKLAQAKEVVAELVSPLGFYAGDDYRQLWNRDLGYSLPVLIEMGHGNKVEAHLAQFLERQLPSGEIPSMVQTKDGIIRNLTKPSLYLRSLKYRGLYALDNFTQYAKNFHNWTMDNPLIFLVSARTYENMTKKETFSRNYGQCIDLLKNFVERARDRNGMIKGANWMDAMDVYNSKYAFHNHVWLYRMYKAYGMDRKAEDVEGTIGRFWDEKLGFYADYLGGNHFDALSHAMALKEDLIPKDRTDSVLRMFERARTEHGYLNIYPSYPYGVCTQFPNVYQNETVWPFIELRIAEACLKLGMKDSVKEIKLLMESRKGFNEWYSPLTGNPEGSKKQLLTACAYIGVCNL